MRNKKKQEVVASTYEMLIDRVGCSMEDTMQADHLLEVFNWYASKANNGLNLLKFLCLSSDDTPFKVNFSQCHQKCICSHSDWQASGWSYLCNCTGVEQPNCQKERQGLYLQGDHQSFKLFFFTQLELLITRRLEEESKSLCLPSTKVCKIYISMNCGIYLHNFSMYEKI